MSTDPSVPSAVPPAAVAPNGSAAGDGFDLDAPWQLHAQVSIRPERFGALLYHFGTRRLSFLKSPELLGVVTGLARHPTARAACEAAGVRPAEVPQYQAALRTLAGSQMISPR